ncbi:hypothetical protein, partial [Thalassovita aquimarina]|uniref:hypothetical protein n=1 Tax=Thalassovita aquimarina TaxID=2785917 RepID=UPI001BAEE5B5
QVPEGLPLRNRARCNRHLLAMSPDPKNFFDPHASTTIAAESIRIRKYTLRAETDSTLQYLLKTWGPKKKYDNANRLHQ